MPTFDAVTTVTTGNTIDAVGSPAAAGGAAQVPALELPGSALGVAAIARVPGGWLVGQGLEAVLAAHAPAEVPALLAAVEARAVAGRWVAGFVAYEAASGLDPALTARQLPTGLPAALFLVFAGRRRLAALPAPFATQAGARAAAAPSPRPSRWQPTLSEPRYLAGVEAVRDAIARGDVYQVNYTFRLREEVRPREGVPAAAWPLFQRLLGTQPPPWAFYLSWGGLAICSASPELFFRRAGERIVCRPMKGTAARGRWAAEDLVAGERLRASAKERAENLMIVDMVRNDLGRLARPGSVAVEELFALERHATVWQLTSQVAARTRAPLPELFAALFPSASVTGAPKRSAMELIAGLEDEPRGVYTGAAGWVGPGRRACFNVAIRTATVRQHDGGATAEYGTGGGVVWDSVPAAEHRECLLKALVLTAPPRPRFDLLETLRWQPRRGLLRRRDHLRRLAASAAYFGWSCDLERAASALAAAVAELPPRPHRVRLLLDPRGGFRVETAVLVPAPRRPRVALAAQPVATSDPLLFHKTTHRELYERARHERPGCDEVLLHNPQGELTEATRANVVVARAGRLVTPPLACGLLPGVLRASLLRRGVVREEVVPVAELGPHSELWLVSSLRGWRRAVLAEGAC